MFDEAQRALQQRHDTSRIADRIREKFLTEVIAPDHQAFIESADMFFLATLDQQGHPSCSYKGGEPGFVKVVDERAVAFPNYDGNGMNLSFVPRVGQTTPVPGWKRDDWAKDYLPAGDPAGNSPNSTEGP